LRILGPLLGTNGISPCPAWVTLAVARPSPA
jgi:hypothetical protein